MYLRQQSRCKTIGSQHNRHQRNYFSIDTFYWLKIEILLSTITKLNPFEYTPCFIKKTTRYLIAHDFGKCWPIFFLFHCYVGLSIDCVMNLSLKIPSHLKRVATTLWNFNVQIWSKSTLTNISFSLSVISLQTGLLYLQAADAVWLKNCNITLSFLIDSAGRYLFRELCLPWHSVHHSLLPVSGVGSNLQVGGRRKFFDVPPHFSLGPPTWRGTTIVCYRLRDNWIGEVMRGNKSNGA